MTHSQAIELRAARLELTRAVEDCPHWDIDGILDAWGGPYACCYRVMDARRKVRALKAKDQQ